MISHVIYLSIIIILVMIIIFYKKEGDKAIKINNFVDRITYREKPLRQFSKQQILMKKSFNTYRDEIDEIINNANDFGEGNKLSNACYYILQGGKRLRPMIIMEIARANSLNNKLDVVDPADAALFIEYLHTASLVVDDLPCFDDDNERRGKESLHSKTNPAIAQMAALSLISSAFQNITRQIEWIRRNCPKFNNIDKIGTHIYHDVSQSIGVFGAAGGQFMDSSLNEEELFEQCGDDAILKIMQLKTAAIFEISFITGWLISGGSTNDIEEIKYAGKCFGTAFQIADDIGDMKQDAIRKEKGKPGWNFANEYGRDVAINLINTNLKTCRLILDKRKLFTPVWKEIYEKVWKMTHAN